MTNFQLRQRIATNFTDRYEPDYYREFDEIELFYAQDEASELIAE